MFEYDIPNQQQSPLPMPGGPLGNLQSQVASVLNANGNENNIYVPGGPGEPVFQIPNVRIPLVSILRRLVRW